MINTLLLLLPWQPTSRLTAGQAHAGNHSPCFENIADTRQSDHKSNGRQTDPDQDEEEDGGSLS